MATVKQAIADIEKVIREALEVSNKAQIRKLRNDDGELTGEISDDGKTWHRFVIGEDGAEIFED